MAMNTFKYREDWKNADGSKSTTGEVGFYLRGINGSNNDTMSVYGPTRAIGMFKKAFAQHPWLLQGDVDEALERLLGDTYHSSGYLQTRLAWAVEASLEIQLSAELFTKEGEKKPTPLRVYRVSLRLSWPSTGGTPAEAQAAINLYQKYTALALDLQMMFADAYICLS